MKIRAALVTLFCGLMLAAKSNDVTIDQLAKKYQNIRHIEAQIAQTKTSEILTRPMKSKVTLTVDGDVVSWKTTSPVTSTMVWTKDGVQVVDSKGTAKKVPPNPGLSKTLGILRSLVTADLKGLQTEFDLRTEGSKLFAVPKNKGETPIQQIEISFKDNLEISRVDVFLPSELLMLDFQTFVAR